LLNKLSKYISYCTKNTVLFIKTVQVILKWKIVGDVSPNAMKSKYVFCERKAVILFVVLIEIVKTT